MVALAHLFDRAKFPVAHGDLRPLDKALIVIPNHSQVAVLLAQQLQPAVLGPVGVLVLVDKNVAERAAVAVAHLWEELEQVHAAEQQVVEVHGVGRVGALLVALVDVGGRLLEEARHLQPVGLGVQQRVLGLGDLAPDAARREALGVDVQLIHAGLHQPQRVLLVVDREAAGVAQALGVGAQHPGAGRVEGHHPHRPGPAAHQGLHPLAHLAGGLVCEGDGQDLARPRGPAAHQVRDAVREHAGLARAGAGEDQQRPLAMQHGLALGLVQPLQQGLGRGRCAHRIEDRGAGGGSGRERAGWLTLFRMNRHPRSQCRALAAAAFAAVTFVGCEADGDGRDRQLISAAGSGRRARCARCFSRGQMSTLGTHHARPP